MNNSKATTRQVLLILQISAAAVFFGRAWQHLFWDAPFRTLLWDEGWMRPIIESVFQTDWGNYITSPAVDQGINTTIKGFGIFYILCGLVAIFARKLPGIIWSILLLGSGALILLALLYCKERFFSIGQFFEYSLQFISPYLLYRVLKEKSLSAHLIYVMRIAIALTFTCHGLYAINYYPRPGEFVEMTMNILPIGEEGAQQLLWWAGILDFVASAIILFLPVKWIKAALLYTILWGLATAVARIWAHLEIEMIAESLHQWLYEAIYRAPHFMIPLALFLIVAGKTSTGYFNATQND